VGYDADFVVWSPEEMFTINTANIQHKNKITPYLGMQLSGVIHKVQCTTQGILMTIPLYFSSVQKIIMEL
jgi:dihydroorotase-like cyclic amidohydrolase